MKPRPCDMFLPHSPIFLPHVLRLRLFFEKCICYRPAAALPETDLCCPNAQCAVETTKSIRDDDDAGKSRNQSTPNCPVIALVNHAIGDKAPKRHPTQGGTRSRHSLSDCTYLQCRQAHFFSPRGNSRTYTATYLVLHIYWSQAESQFAEALKNHEAQK